METTSLRDEQIWVSQAVADSTAFATLYDYYAPRIYTYIRYRVNDIHTAEDLTAQTFERALANLSRYQPAQAPFSAWLFGIAHHVVSQHYRRRLIFFPLEAVYQRAAEAVLPEDLYIAQESQACLMKAVRRLPERERNLLALKFAGGLTNRQIAAITRLSESNVGVILYRSIKQLREELKHE
jgi:RNA polymerase sigma-70 factor (ECF subfamily)